MPWWLKRALAIATVGLSFAYLVFILNPIQLLSVLLYPFSVRAFRQVNRWCARSIWGIWVLIGERQHQIAVRVSGDPIPRRENAILLPNHQSMADIFVLLCFAWRAGRLGDMKWFAKDTLKWVPGVGWGMRFLDCVFVKRDWAKDSSNIERLFGKYKRDHIPIFLVTFLEGTRRTPEKQAAAREYAAQHNLQAPEHTLIPRTKGLIATVEGLHDHVDAVYDLTIGYQRPIPSLMDCFLGKVSRLDVHVRRTPIEHIPTEEAALREWAIERFAEKDQRLAEFATTGRFDGTDMEGEVRLSDWFRPESDRALGSTAGPRPVDH